MNDRERSNQKGEEKNPEHQQPKPISLWFERMNERTEPRYAVLANTSGDQTPRTKREKKN